VPLLPASDQSLLVRTDFSDDLAWRRLLDLAAAPSQDDGFMANFTSVDDRGFDQSDWQSAKAAVPEDGQAAVLFIADAVTFASPELPILVVDLLDFEGEHLPPFRCIPAELWAVENNLNIANMDFEEFANAAADDGVFRGFSN
jgi:hypothetical protein